MTDRILTLAQATKEVPLSKATLHRVASRGTNSPFIKVEGRWMVYESELHSWVRSHSRPRQPDAMPKSRRRGMDPARFLAEADRRARRAA